MDEQMISCTIDGKTVTVERGSRILDACERAGIKIPTLCYLKDVNSHGSCGVCMVEVEGAKRFGSLLHAYRYAGHGDPYPYPTGPCMPESSILNWCWPIIPSVRPVNAISIVNCRH